VHVGNPLAQATLDVWQTVAGGEAVHGAPERQALQVPPPQTRLAPHAVPFAAGVKVSLQLGEGVQRSEPRSHGFAGTHEAAGTQAAQRPPLQTFPPPQRAPSGSGAPVSVQTEAPVLQLVRHAVQEPAGVQSSPAAQATQVPALQTSSAPQGVPSATGVPVSVQIGPGPQDSVPVSHGFAGMHDPAAQATQKPALQMLSVPQGVPSGRLPLSMQTPEPLAQVIAAVRHGVSVAHDWPSVHAPHTPLEQTWFAPQVAPFASMTLLSTQTGPAVQE